MKKIIALLLAALLMLSTAVAVNAQAIKDVFNVGSESGEINDIRIKTAPMGEGDELFDLERVKYTSTYAAGGDYYSDVDYFTGYVHHYSKVDSDYNLQIEVVIKAAAEATSGTLIVPLDGVYDTSDAVVNLNKPYFKNFTYQVGEGAVTNTNVLTGPVYGISGTGHYLSIPLSSPNTAETNLNVYVRCLFDRDFVAQIPDGAATFFSNYATVVEGTVDDTITRNLVAENDGVFLYRDLAYYGTQLTQIDSGKIYYGLETQTVAIHPNVYFDTDDWDSYYNISMSDTDSPIEFTVSFNPGVNVVMNPIAGVNATISGDITTGFTITGKIINPSSTSAVLPQSYGVRKAIGLNMLNLRINVPSEYKNIGNVVITESATAYTNQGPETVTGTVSIEVIPPVQNIKDNAFTIYTQNVRRVIDLNNPNFVQDDLASTLYSLENVGVLPVYGVSMIWENDSDVPAYVSSIKNTWNYNCNMSFTTSTGRVITINAVPTHNANANINGIRTIGYDNTYDVQLNSGEWISKIESFPYYEENGTTVSSSIRGDDHSRMLPFMLSFMLPPQGKNLKTNTALVDGDISVLDYIFKYKYIYTYDGRTDTDVNNDEVYSGDYSTITRQASLLYTEGKAVYAACMGVTNQAYNNMPAMSGDRTTDYEAYLSLYNGVSNTDTDEYYVTYGELLNSDWTNPVVTVRLPQGVKLNTSDESFTQTGVDKYSFEFAAREFNENERVVDATRTGTVELVTDTDGREVWRYKLNTSICRAGLSSAEVSSGSMPYYQSLPVPLVLTSDAKGGKQYADLYISSDPTKNFDMTILRNYKSNSRPETIQKITDTSDVNGNNSSSDTVGYLTNITINTVAESYKIDAKTEYKNSLGAFRNVSLSSIPVNVGGTNEFRTILTNAGNISISNMTIEDELPVFDGTPTTYVADSVVVEILDENNQAVDITEDVTVTVSNSDRKIVVNLGDTVLNPGYSVRMTAAFATPAGTTLGVTDDNDITMKSYFANSLKTTKVLQPYITQGWGEEPEYRLIFMNKQPGETPVTYEIKYQDPSEPYTLTAAPITEAGLYVKNGVPLYPNAAHEDDYLFAGWFTTESAAYSNVENGNQHHVSPSYAFPQTFDLDDYAVEEDIDGQDVMTVYLYAGWARPGSVDKDSKDANTYSNSATSFDGFSLQGVQIRSKDLNDPYHPVPDKNYIEDGLRFVTVYSNSMLSELEGLWSATTDVRYGYAVCASQNFSGSELKLDESNNFIIDEDCTKSVNAQNHKYFTNYRLSTFVVKFDDVSSENLAAYKAMNFEARAYVKYTDSNGFARVGYDVYSGTQFKGGCRTSFASTLAAVQGMYVVKPELQ